MMTDLTIPGEAVNYAYACTNSISLDRQRTVRRSIEVAAPRIVATELRRLADQFETEAHSAEARVDVHAEARNEIGMTIATGTAEIYESAAQRLRDRADELDGGA